MKPIFLIIIYSLLFFSKTLQAQQIDSIFFHLYTDSLKKGTYNYINIDGKTNSGKWLPLTAREIESSATDGTFKDNSLVIDKNFNRDSVIITAMLKSDNRIKKTITIHIKKLEDNEILKTSEEIFQEMKQPKNKKKKEKHLE